MEQAKEQQPWPREEAEQQQPWPMEEADEQKETDQAEKKIALMKLIEQLREAKQHAKAEMCRSWGCLNITFKK